MLVYDEDEVLEPPVVPLPPQVAEDIEAEERLLMEAIARSDLEDAASRRGLESSRAAAL